MLTTQPTRAVIASLALGLLCVAPCHAQTVDTDENAVDAARAALEEWVDVRAEIASEKREWAVGKEVLSDRIDVLRNEIESFRARIAETRVSIANAEKELVELRSEHEALNEASSAVADQVVAYEERTKGLLTRMPMPILDKVEQIRQRFPEDPNDTRMSLSQRFVTIAGILNELDKFNGEVHQTSELRSLGPDTTAEVSTIYVGLGQAYYVTNDGAAAGVGVPGPTGWVWSPRNEDAAQITLAVQILQDAEVASFVRLPLTVQ